MRLHWHRRDLRGPDNTALARAAERGGVLPVFVLDDAVLDHGSTPRVRFMLDALADLLTLTHTACSRLSVTSASHPDQPLSSLLGCACSLC